MAFDYITPEEAIARPGLRMVVVRNVPSPWGEAAKGLFYMKRLDWAAVGLAYDDPALADWMGGTLSAPVAVYEDEKPRAGWAEILLLAERLAPEPSLIPKDAAERALMFGLCHEIFGEQGLAWTRRLQGVHAGLTGQGGWSEAICNYLADKYGYSREDGEAAGDRVRELLAMLSARLKAQAGSGSDYLVGDAPSAADLYCAATMALFAPLPEDQCAMHEAIRPAYELLDAPTRAALDPVLLEHRDRMYARHLELPLKL